MLTESELQKFVFDEEEGMLMQFHNGDGLSEDKLRQLYVHLEEYRVGWAGKAEIPRDIAAQLMGLVFGLYHDVDIYDDSPDCHYRPVVAKLATCVELLFNGKEDESSGTLSEIVQIEF